MTLRDRLLEVHDLILRTAAANWARDPRVLGSVARGDEREDSDVDFLVRLDRGRTLPDLAHLDTAFETLLGPRWARPLGLYVRLMCES